MLMSQFFLPALKETPADATLLSHQLMLRSGMIRQMASGLYVWLPLGLRVLRRVEQIVREEMDGIGALELLMPMVQPGELWQESDRWDQYGAELLRFKDRHDNDFCLGPTHEEIICSVMRKELKSYKQLPTTVYQIQTKFRDEIRPRFGVMRAREFMMKDAYSFDIDKTAMNQRYQAMYDAYTRIFTRLGLDFRAVLADSGSIGGDFSHEFQVLADSGEDIVVHSDGSDYAANIERAQAWYDAEMDVPPYDSVNPMEDWPTPNCKTIEDLSQHEQVDASHSVKTLIVQGRNVPMVALILRGDHDLNTIKAEHHEQIATPLVFISESEVEQALGVSFGSIGPVGLTIPVIVDYAALQLVDFVCGANKDGYHKRHVCWGRDVATFDKADLRNVVEGDKSPDGEGTLRFCRGIEVGHIFQLGDKYSKSMDVSVLNDGGKAVCVQMGCYGIGISRVIAAAIEQHHDQSGIIWPEAMSPFQIAIVPVQLHKSYRVREYVEQLYQRLQDEGIDVILDDRKERPGVLFATMDLIGIPHRLVVSEKGIDAGTIEYKARESDEVQYWSIDDVLTQIKSIV